MHDIITRRIDNLTKLKIKEHANMCINKFKTTVIEGNTLFSSENSGGINASGFSAENQA